MKLDTNVTIALALLAGAAVGGGAVYWLGARPEPDSMASMEAESTAEREVLYWVAPMDPNYRSDSPGKSPMGMDLVPVYADDAPPSDSEGVTVDPRFLQNFAVRTTPVAEGSMPVTIRTLGVLAHNEEKVFSVNTKFEGWIEDARFNNVGERVQQGDVLFAIYSPQLVTTQREYLAAIAYETRLRESNAYDEAVERAGSLVGAAEERLRYWDITPEQIEDLRSSETASRTVEFASPVSGFIVEKMGDSLEGMKLTPGMTVLKIADHSTLWAEVEFYESDLQYLREGQRVSVEVEAFPSRSWQGRILFFNPAVSPETRTLTGFVEIANEDLRLRPQMFATITASLGGLGECPHGARAIRAAQRRSRGRDRREGRRPLRAAGGPPRPHERRHAGGPPRSRPRRRDRHVLAVPDRLREQPPRRHHAASGRAVGRAGDGHGDEDRHGRPADAGDGSLHARHGPLEALRRPPS